MTSITPSTVEIHTCPHDTPSIPPWFAEVVVLARHFLQRGLLDAIGQRVRLARGRAGLYDVIDFVAILLGYAAGAEPTLETFFDRLRPFAQPFMALFGRDYLPHRSTLSRFLADIDASCLEALRQLFLEDLCQHGFMGEHLGGLFDRHGHRLVVFDVDGTRQAARQRALATSPEFPAPHRRMQPACAPGYTGRTRGEVVRTRTTVLQAHTQQWLGTFAGAGNGDYSAELESACCVIAVYLRAKGLSVSQGLLRLDGLYGTASGLARVQQYGLGFLVRGRDYQLLDHPLVQARVRRPCDGELQHPETRVRREVFEVGYLTNWLEPLPGFDLTCRVVVTRRAAPADPEEVVVGKLIGSYVYELFLTSHPQQRLSARDIVELYHHRGAFEQVLSDEDTEQDPDRWCSHSPYGQEFWQIVSQWVWNTRLELGSIGHDAELRWTRWSDTPSALTPTSASPMCESSVIAVSLEAIAEEVVDTYGPLEWAGEWAKARGRFSGQDFELLADGTLRCPAEKILRPRERRKLPNGDLRILYSAQQADCRACPLAARCLGIGASGATPRRVSGYRKRLGQHTRPKQAPWHDQPVGQTSEVQHGPPQQELLWGDLGGRRVRRDFFVPLRRQQVVIEEHAEDRLPPPAAPRTLSRAERAHRRLTWDARRTRNASTAGQFRYHVTIFGIAPPLATYLGLLPGPAG